MMTEHLPSPVHGTETEIPVIPANTHLATLENGLTLILREDHSAPVTSAQAWCKAGSIDEGQWLGAGLSHILEHMLFKGTTTRGPGRIDQEIQDAGGQMNAYTSFDRTVYYINVPSTGTAVAIDILCDIMKHATLPEDELVKEKQVILREMDMCQDDPGRRSGRRLFETAYTRSPYRYAIIGYPDVFNQVQREDVVAYYREKYVPANLFFVIVGDFQAGEVEDQIRQAFAQVRTKPLPASVLPDEPKQAGEREVIEEAPIELGHFHMAWHIPDVRHPDIPALDVLATLLGSGQSSRLYQEVREKKGCVHSADAFTYNPGNPGLFGMSAMVDAPRFKEAREAMLFELDRMKNEWVASAELAKAVKQFTAATLATRKTMQGQAQDLGANWLAATDLNFSERYLAAVKRLTPEDLQRVARQYLTTDNRTTYALLPRGSAPKPALAAVQALEHPIQLFVLPNGLRLLVKEDHRLPFVQFRAALQGGVLAETAANNGLSLLMAKMLLKGTSRRSAEQIVTEIESVGGSIDSYGGNNSFGVSAEVLNGDFETGIDLLADVLLDPAFPPAQLEREREVQLAGIRAQKDHLLQSAGRIMRRALFGETGYGLDLTGSEETVAKLQVPDLNALHQRLVTPQNCVLAIYGDIEALPVKEAVERWLGRWRKGPSVAAAPLPIRPPSEIVHVSETRDKKQAVLVVGFPGVHLNDPDRYALELLQEALSDLGSRLFIRIRENLGLAYFVGAQNLAGLQPGYFAFYAGTAPEKAALVETELLIEAKQLGEEGLTESELKRAKAKIVGHKKIARQDLGSYAMTTALDELYGLGYANCDTEDRHYEAVTLEQIKIVARKYLNPQGCVVAWIRPQEQSRPPV
ncbi:MAG: insulinase family protein [Verrucomicrobia bacterium]|nr:insulinase family protein [Verrucomicrobiota bacterium]